jgi:hypothetical protein
VAPRTPERGSEIPRGTFDLSNYNFPQRRRRVGLSRLSQSVPADAHSNRAFGYIVSVSFSSGDCCEVGRCVPAIFGVRVAPARDEPRTGSSNSERESTTGRSTNYGSGHLIRVFRDIGRIFSLLFLLAHPSPIGHPLRARVQRRKRNMVSPRAKNGFNCVSCGTHRGGRAGGVSFGKTRTPRSRGLNGAGTVCRHRLARAGSISSVRPG